MATKWKLDPTHSDVVFKIKHLVISTVTGNFRQFGGQVETSSEQSFADAKVDFEIDVNSIDTNQEQRDQHLKSEDFFDAGTFPKIKFSSTSLEGSGEDFELVGDLTIRGNTKPVRLKAAFGGMVTDAYGQQKAGFEVEGEISRKEFGLTWNAVTEAGSVVVSDKVKFLANVQFVKE